VLDNVRDRFGSNAIIRAVLVGRDQGLTVPLLPDPVPGSSPET
jgi:DNA polymerase-4